jgi:hypothetical protein
MRTRILISIVRSHPYSSAPTRAPGPDQEEHPVGAQGIGLPRALSLFTKLPRRLAFSAIQRAYKESWGIYLCPNPLPSERDACLCIIIDVGAFAPIPSFTVLS